MHLIRSLFRARACLLAPVLAGGLVACGQAPPAPLPAIVLTEVPEAATGGADRVRPIAGRVTGADPDDRIVLYARSGVWWVQPLAARPFTEVGSDGGWQTTTHLGTEYAALLVGPGYQVQATLDALPQVGDRVRAVQVAHGKGDFAARPRHIVSFSGYEWEVRDAPSDRGGTNYYDARNVHLDERGRLHLKLTRRGDRWTGAEVSLTRPLGYGTYVFVTGDTSDMDPCGGARPAHLGRQRGRAQPS